MKFDKKIIEATILKRYKRFLSDIQLSDGTIVNAHVPNTGSMKTCWEEGWKVLITHSDDPKRKLKYTLECTHNNETYICVNTSLPNKIVKEALLEKLIPEVEQYKTVKPEQKIFDSRIDFLLQQEGLEDCYIEVKNVTLLGENRIALFPDSVSTRGQKHLQDLVKIKKAGHRAIMFYLVNRDDVDSFSPAKEIDPKYAALLKEAQDNGVEILVYQTKITPEEIIIKKKLPIKL